VGQDLPDFQAFGLSQETSQTITAGIAAGLAGAMVWGCGTWRRGGRSMRRVECRGRATGRHRTGACDLLRLHRTGALTGAAALLNAVRFNQVPSNAGIGMELQVIAAVIVGGVSVNGGRGTVAGALLGVVLLGMIGPALTFLGISAYWERALQGAIILAAVAIDALRGRSEKHAGVLAARA
jgi:rhamnose transport system permease protein